jgi:3-isopropylmalate/(R)-2-methylmalate dehydratase large subunit
MNGKPPAGRPRSLFEKVWERHVVTRDDEGNELIFVDRHLAHEGSFHAFGKLAARSLPVARPDLTLLVADHYAPTRNRHLPIPDPEIARVSSLLAENAQRFGLELIGLDDPRQGIVHVVGPELGFTLPGLTIVCGDSHTSTHGAFGAVAFGIGASEVAHVLATQTLWQRRPAAKRVRFEGEPAPSVAAKDLVLAMIAQIGADGGTGSALEYAGPAVEALSMEGRMTMCNLSIECGARFGLVAPDETTFAWVEGRPLAPSGTLLARAIEDWRGLASEPGAAFDEEIRVEVEGLTPMVTWGTSPDQATPVAGHVPDPATLPTAAKRDAAAEALAYMGLQPGQALAGLPIDRVFVGSCTNARLEDLRAAASVLAGRRVAVPTLVSPGSMTVKRLAEAEGIDRVFLEAGAEWADSGCSMCVGMNGDLVPPGERCASTSNRNFPGRQGPGSRTHLMSPVMAATAAVAGSLLPPEAAP